MLKRNVQHFNREGGKKGIEKLDKNEFTEQIIQNDLLLSGDRTDQAIVEEEKQPVPESEF